MFLCRSRLAAASVSLANSEGLREESRMAVIPLLCAIFLANQGEDDAAGEVLPWVRSSSLYDTESALHPSACFPPPLPFLSFLMAQSIMFFMLVGFKNLTWLTCLKSSLYWIIQNDESAMLQEEKEAEKMILEAYAALLLAFLSTERLVYSLNLSQCSVSMFSY